MKTLKKIILLSCLFLTTNFSYASNSFDSKINDFSSEIKQGLQNKYNFEEFKTHLLLLSKLENLSFGDLIFALKNIKKSNDLYIKKLDEILLEEMSLLINVPITSFDHLSETFWHSDEDSNLIDDLLNKDRAHLLLEDIVGRTCVMIKQLDEYIISIYKNNILN